jgi:hypothetical protein
MSKYRLSDTQDNADLLAIFTPVRADIKKAIAKAIELTSAKNDEQFLAEVMTGNCPRCGSNQIKDCRKVEGINDITVGLCMQCGLLWCLECGKLLVDNIHCNHWDICMKCDIVDECDIDLKDCKQITDNASWVR